MCSGEGRRETAFGTQVCLFDVSWEKSSSDVKFYLHTRRLWQVKMVERIFLWKITYKENKLRTAAAMAKRLPRFAEQARTDGTKKGSRGRVECNTLAKVIVAREGARSLVMANSLVFQNYFCRVYVTLTGQWLWRNVHCWYCCYNIRIIVCLMFWQILLDINSYIFPYKYIYLLHLLPVLHLKRCCLVCKWHPAINMC